MPHIIIAQTEEDLCSEIINFKRQMEVLNIVKALNGSELFIEQTTSSIIESAEKTINGLKAIIYVSERPLYQRNYHGMRAK